MSDMIIIKPKAQDEKVLQDLAFSIAGPNFIADLLLQRGINEKEKARDFFLATMLQSPENQMLLGMTQAITCLKEILRQEQKITVHGDYDVDGITGTAILYLGLKALGFNVDWFLPNRFVEGYGISARSVEKIQQQGSQWIISVDTGIAAVAEVAMAKALGMGMIITDHHQAAEILPNADAIINPNQPGCTYPNKGLSGVGVAYKLLQALMQDMGKGSAEKYLDLVALGSLADNVPLVGENRSLVRLGLRQLKTDPLPGLSVLLKHLGLLNAEQASLSSTDILFKVTPLINAVGRMGNPAIALRLLLAETEAEAETHFTEMQLENEKRKKLDQSITEQAIRMVLEDPTYLEAGCLVLASSEWHEGVIGIVAARLVEKFRRPVFILAIDAHGMAKASGRTIPGFNLYKALATIPEIFEKWGGHYYACGLSIRAENIPRFREQMNTLAAIHLAGNDFKQLVQTTAAVELHELTENNLLWLKRFEPFGPLNENPIFYSENLKVTGAPRIVGEKHLKLTLSNGQASFDAIGFGLGHLCEAITQKKSVDKIAFYPEWNTFKGMRKIQLRLVAVE